MYISQLTLNRMDRLTMRRLSNVYRLHQFVMSGFSEYDHLSRVLYRVEPEIKNNTVQILLQSNLKPVWKDTDDEKMLQFQVKELTPHFSNGNQYRFRLRANPVVKKDGKRYGLIRDDALLEWIRKKEKIVGALFQNLIVIDEGYLNGSRKKSDKTDNIKIKAVRYEGVLSINDAELFTKALNNGIGPAKAFGCGLLSLARA